MTQRVKRGLISIVMAVALVISVLAGVLPVQSIKVGAETEPDYLTFTAEEFNYSYVTVNLNDGTLEYSVNNDEWAAYTSNTSVTLKNGDTVRFRGGSNSGKRLFGSNNRVTIYGKVACSGNIMTLLDYNDPDNARMGANCFSYMFNGCTGLTSAPALPATTLTQGCYSSMFFGCAGLTLAPELPATVLREDCYNQMFNGCSGLTSAPELPATVLRENCYYSMFSHCTGLTSAPELPATTLATKCYYGMFWDCTGLTKAPALPATTLADSCYRSMFGGCTGLTEPPELPATYLAPYCYYYMFQSCTGIMLSASLTAEYNISYRIPASGEVYGGDDALTEMFAGTGGLFKGTPSLNTTYYLYKEAADPVVVEDDTDYLTFTAEQDNSSVTLNLYNSLEYSKGNDDWESYSSGTVVPLNTGEAVRFRGTNGTSGTPYGVQLFNNDRHVEISGKVACSGNIMTLLNYYDPDNATMGTYCFSYMFKDCTGLTSAPALPATALADSCYYQMFKDCTGLTEPPALPATTLAFYCYKQMFDGCTGLTSAPSLPAKILSKSCYSGMFVGCTGLTSAPALPATMLAKDCYLEMFYGCTGLTSAPELPATTLAYTNGCYQSMFSGCTGLTSAPALPATTLADYCYYKMFNGCTSLTEPPALPATALPDSCYYGMFSGCTSLTEAPELPAITLAKSCYNQMFSGCTGIKLSETQTEYYNAEYRIPSSDTGTDASYALNNMFASTGGTFAGTPVINKTYYIHKEAADPVVVEDDTDYLTFTAEQDNSSVTLNLYNSLEYSKGNDDWESYSSGTVVPLNTGEAVRFRGTNGTSGTPYGVQLFNNDRHVEISGKVACSGNIMTLLNYYDPDNATMGTYCFSYMFKDCTGLTSAPALPATALADSCYYQMFKDCTGLTSAPALPAKTLSKSCYFGMFVGCTGLTSAPELSATTLANRCYLEMFYGCTGLTSAPELPATVLREDCYNSMFRGCTGLTEPPALPATVLADSCYYQMFNGCTGLTEPPALPATALADSCYYQMFNGCTGLTEAPELPATILAKSCYNQMFSGCTGIKLSETQTEYYNAEYRIPSSDTGTDASYALNNMFASTGGTFTGSPTINKNYYIHKEAAVTYTKVEATPATYEADGNIEYYIGSDGKFYKSEDDTTFTEIEENSWIIPRLTAYMQIDTNSSNGVDVNIGAPLPEGENINDYSIKFGDTVQSFSKCSTVVIDGTTYYLVKVTCPAKNMADEYAYAVLKNNVAQAGASGTVSVRGYADTVIKGNYTAPVKKICRAMLAYGASAQTYFGHNTDDLANRYNSTGDGADYSGVAVPNSVFDKTGLNEALAEAPVEYAGMSLTFKHDTYISLAFKVKSGTQDEAVTYVNNSFTLGGNPVSAEKNGTKFVVIRTEGIPVKSLLNDIALRFGGTDYTVNAKQYMTLANAGTNENLKNVCKALYNYYLCATAQTAQ